MEEWLLTQGAYMLRIMIAACCGAAIGYERQNRLKTAGIRTHIVVSIASSLMMIISKYGFWDVISREGIDLDPSRIAAGIVTAIGFLGAGVIFVHNKTVSGLTTAAGIWATVGIGMAIGAGMYFIGIACCLFIIIMQVLLHNRRAILKTPMLEKIIFRVQPGENQLPEYIKKLKSRQIEIVNTAINREADGSIEIKIYVRFPDTYSIEDVYQLLIEDPSIQSVEM